MPINSFLYPGAKFTPPYQVANSLRFNRASSSSGDSLERTPSSASNRRTFTFSCWFKLGKLASSTSDFYQLFGGNSGGVNDGLWIDSNDRLYVYIDSGERRITNQRLRDPSSWYHVVLAIDTTQSTASNRIKLYLNGSEITSFSTNSDPSLNYDSGVNNTTVQYIGERINDDFFDGYMAEAVLVDGSQLDQTSFGEFDSDSPNIWKPIDVSGLTFGTNGFYLDFENASSLGADVSGNSNNFTVNNLTAIDQSTDTCTNNFATLNPLNSGTITFSDGNLTVVSGSDYHATTGTIGVQSGKWYFEVKINSSGSPQDNLIGITGDNTPVTGTTYDNNPSVIYTGSGTIDKDGTQVQSSLAGFSTGSIVGIALNMDDLEIEFYHNNSKQGSTQSISSFSGFYLPFYIGANARTASFNFGSPPYSITSGNSDANGYGNFEYTVPSGYYSLNTKNLAEFG
jgi:hypothetical protein